LTRGSLPQWAMGDPLVAAVIIGAIAASAVGTGWLRNFALSRELVDVPNARSSHEVPTPRGGGVAIVVVVLAALLLLAWLDVLSVPLLVAMSGAGLLVGGIGWIDDQGHVPALWRLVIHFAAATWALVWLGGLPPLPVLGSTIDLGWIGHGLAALYLVWLLNLYNFMDGIDGIAGIEAVTVCLGGVALYILSSATDGTCVMPVVVAGSVGGFLIWNFPRARIFMGDAGSGFIGITLGLLSLEAAAMAPELFWGWIILLGAFVVDATVTLTVRLLSDERVHEAHRSHAYQHAARSLGSHVPVSLAFGALNLFWLLPVAGLVVLGWLDGFLGVVMAYSPLVWLALRLGAGRTEEFEFE
jgi:Fuc2NAc and GlcNAc transferase